MLARSSPRVPSCAFPTSALPAAPPSDPRPLSGDESCIHWAPPACAVQPWPCHNPAKEDTVHIWCASCVPTAHLPLSPGKEMGTHWAPAGCDSLRHSWPHRSCPSSVHMARGKGTLIKHLLCAGHLTSLTCVPPNALVGPFSPPLPPREASASRAPTVCLAGSTCGPLLLSSLHLLLKEWAFIEH